MQCAEAIGVFKDTYRKGHCAVSENHYGSGTAYYYGTGIETVKEKKLVAGADFAGYPLKDAYYRDMVFLYYESFGEISPEAFAAANMKPFPDGSFWFKITDVFHYSTPEKEELRTRKIENKPCLNNEGGAYNDSALINYYRRISHLKLPLIPINYIVLSNLLKRDFKSDKPNQKWVRDITYISTDERWLYAAMVKDLCLKKIVGYAFSSRIDTNLTVSALKMAVNRQKPQGI